MVVLMPYFWEDAGFNVRQDISKSVSARYLIQSCENIIMTETDTDLFQGILFSEQ